MVTGALAVSYYGRPRTTMDLDLVIKTCPEESEKLSKTLVRAGVKTSVAKIASAWGSGYRIVTCQDTRSPHSLDIILSDKPLRRMKGTLLGICVFYHEPSQLILAKLRMIKSTRDPERQAIDKADIRSIMESRKIPLRALSEGAIRDGTAAILRGLLRGKYPKKGMKISTLTLRDKKSSASRI